MRLAALALSATAWVAGGAMAAERWWPPIVDPATGVHTPGRWVWADLVTGDVAKAAGFYAQLFGWTFETYGGEDDRDTYTLVLADGLPIGGMVFDPRAAKDDKPAARWVMLLSVPDVTEAAKAVQRQGGEVVLKPAMLGERGETAVFRDPDGVLFGAVRSRNGDPGDYLGDLHEWVWLDLWTSDVERAAAFYRTLAGYEVRPTAADGLRKGVHLVAGGFVRAGIMEKRNKSDTPVWLPYVRVADAQATAAAAPAAGGKVLVAPVDVGRAVVAVIADPTGAPVGIAQLAD
jgi:predicted enzyme related to lactoylglutathione lyase